MRGWIILLILSITMATIASANATTIYVNTTGWWINESQFNDSATPIQSAIENASAGDTIIAVESGIYNGSLWIYKPLTIIAEKEGAIIDAYGNSVGVLITASNVTLKGFVIGNVSKVLGTGINVVNGWNVQLINNTFKLELINGTGIATTNASGIVIENNTVDITANDWATGLSIIESPNAQIKGNNINVYVEASEVKVTASSLDVASQYYLNERSVDANVVALTGYLSKGLGIYAEKSDYMSISGNTLNVVAINLNTSNVAEDQYSANSAGMVVVSCEGVTITDNDLNLIANATTVANVNGIYITASPDCLVNENDISSNATAYHFAQYWIIGVYNSNNAEVSGNKISAVSKALSGYYKKHTSYGMGIDVYGCDSPTIENNNVNVKSVAVNYGSANGICVERANNAMVKENIVTSTTIAARSNPCFGLSLLTLRKSTISDNTVTMKISVNRVSEITGVKANKCDECTIEGNDVIIDTNVKTPWAPNWNVFGISASNNEKLWIKNNDIMIKQTNGTIWAEGIYIEESPYSHVNENKINLSGAGHYPGSLGIDAYRCYRVEVYNNVISIDNRGLSASSVIPEVESIKLPERVINIKKSMNISVEGIKTGADSYGVYIESCDLAKVNGNIISITGLSIITNDKVKSSSYSWTFSEGIDIIWSKAPEVSNNIIKINSNANANASAYIYSEVTTSSYATGITMDDCPPIMDHVPVIKNNKIEIVVSAENSTAYANVTLPEEWPFWDSNSSKFIESIYKVLNTTAYKVKGKRLPRSSWWWLPAAYSYGGAGAEGIDASDSPKVVISGNDISITRKASAIANATLLLNIESSSGAELYGWSAGIWVCQSPNADADISENNINIDGFTKVTAIATENVKTKGALSEIYLDSEDYGILVDLYLEIDTVDYAKHNSISIKNNTINISSKSMSVAKSSSEIDVAWADIDSYSCVAGILAWNSEISGNVININGNSLMDLGASGASIPLAYGEGYAICVGIGTVSSTVTNNKVNVHSSNDGAIMSVKMEEVSTQTTISRGSTAGVSVGIYAPMSRIDSNEVNAVGSVNMSVIASEKNEEAYSFAWGVGAGVGIITWNSNVTRNIVTGNGYSDVKAISEGYYPENESFGINLSVGVLAVPLPLDVLSAKNAEGTVVMFNDLINSRDAGLVAWDNVDARYNYWGDASGPSGLGPGVGDAIYGTENYQPWLTRSYKVVLGERKAYFGFELCRLREGWNTLSIPIALENNTWAAITKLGDGLNYIIAYTWDPVHQKWVQVLDTTKLKPMDALYIKMASEDRVPLCISPRVTNPPIKALKKGWNLIGPAFRPITDSEGYWNGSWEILPVNQTLISAESTSGGLRGYTIVISPPINEHSWVYTANQEKSPYMDVGRGYWIYMENDDTLAGFSATPLKIPYFK